VIHARALATTPRPSASPGPAFRGMRRRLRLPGAAAVAVAATHRAGGALHCNPHLHLLVADGVFVRHPAGGAGFYRAPAPSPKDLSPRSCRRCAVACCAG